MSKVDIPNLSGTIPDHLADDPDRFKRLGFEVRTGQATTGDAVLDALVSADLIGPDGTVPAVDHEVFRSIERKLDGEQGKLAFLATRPVDGETGFLHLMGGQLAAEGSPIDGRSAGLNMTAHGRVEVVQGSAERDFFVFARFVEEQPVPLIDRGHDVTQVVTFGQFEREIATEVLTEAELMPFLRRHLPDQGSQYATYAAIYETLEQMELELPEKTGESPFPAERAAERSALDNHGRFYHEVLATNRAFCQSIPNDFMSRLVESRERFDERFAELTSQHAEMTSRLRIVLQDHRSWPHTDFHEYKEMYSYSTVGQLETLQRESTEMERRLKCIAQQNRTLDLMERYPL